MARKVLAVETRVLGPEHPDTLLTARNLALSLTQQGKHAEAEQMGGQGQHLEGCGGAAETVGGTREMETAVEEGAESEEHAVRKRMREGTQGSRTFADAGSKRKKQ